MQEQHQDLTEKMDRLYELCEKYPNSPRFRAREEAYMRLLNEYEERCDGTLTERPDPQTPGT